MLADYTKFKTKNKEKLTKNTSPDGSVLFEVELKIKDKFGDDDPDYIEVVTLNHLDNLIADATKQRDNAQEILDSFTELKADLEAL